LDFQGLEDLLMINLSGLGKVLQQMIKFIVEILDELFGWNGVKVKPNSDMKGFGQVMSWFVNVFF
jgi:hypothetical protein